MKNHICRRVTALLAICGLAAAQAHATTLAAGDIAIVGMNCTNPDTVTIVPLVNLDCGTVFTLTDNGWLSAGGFRGPSEGTLQFTAPSDIPAGTILAWSGTGKTTNSASEGFAAGSSNWSLSSSSDQIFIVNGGTSAVTNATPASLLIYGLYGNTLGATWDADATSASTSAQPSSLSLTFAPVFQGANGAYAGTTTAASKLTWQSRFATTAGGNWTVNTNAQGQVAQPSGSYCVVSNLVWNRSVNSTWDTTSSNKNFSDGTNTTWFNSSDNVLFGDAGVGAVSVAAGGVTAGTVTVANTTGTYAFSGGSLSAQSLTKNGAGEASLADNGSASSLTINDGSLVIGGSLATTSVTVSNGRLQLGRDNAIADTVHLTLNAGVLAAANHAASFADLTNTGLSTLDLGLGSTKSVLHIGDSHGISWTGTLIIANWNGSSTGGSGDQILFGDSATGLSANQVAQILFLNPIIDGVAQSQDFSASILGTGEIVATTAVPEPQTWATLLGGIGLLVFWSRIHRARRLVAFVKATGSLH
jgi:hypothetical protein